MLTMAGAAAFVAAETGVKRTRATMYNWAMNGMKSGMARVKLQTEIRAGQRFTTEKWIRDFLSMTSRR